jgi:hypothetical protein
MKKLLLLLSVLFALNIYSQSLKGFSIGRPSSENFLHTRVGGVLGKIYPNKLKDGRIYQIEFHFQIGDFNTFKNFISYIEKSYNIKFKSGWYGHILSERNYKDLNLFAIKNNMRYFIARPNRMGLEDPTDNTMVFYFHDFDLLYTF